MEVRIRARVHPTETDEKVGQAVRALFDVELERRGDHLEGTCHDLDRLHKRLRKLRVLDAARRVLLAGMRNDTTRIFLNRQAAFMGRVNFSSTAPLGPIVVEIEDEDIQGIIDELAPETVEGREIV